MTVDSDPWVWENVFPQLQQEYNHRVVCHELKADKIVTPTRFEAFFLDGYHEYNQVKADIANYRPQLKSGAIMIFHDLYIDGVYRGIIDSGLTPLHIQTTAGIGVCWND
jgi:hypothetical protein